MRYNTTQVPSRWCMVHVLEVIHGASGARARGDAWCKLPHGNAQARVLRRRAQAFPGQLCRSKNTSNVEAQTHRKRRRPDAGANGYHKEPKHHSTRPCCVRARGGGGFLSIVDIQCALCVHMLSDVYALMLSRHACRVYARAAAY